MHPLTSFTNFNQLPPDIRYLIWSLTMPGPRIHRISRPEAHLPATGSCRAPLNLLLACHESHNEVLHNLKRVPLPSHDGPCPSVLSSSNSASPIALKSYRPCCPYILFNPLLDTLYLPGTPIPLKYRQWFSRSIDFSMIRRLAVDAAWSYQRPTGYDERISIPTIVSLLGSVQNLYIVSERSYFRSLGAAPFRDALLSWGKAIPIEGMVWEEKDQVLTHRYNPASGVGHGGFWGWVEPVDMSFWEDLTQASWREAALAAELHEERERLLREDCDGATKWTLPRVEMRFLRSERSYFVGLTNPSFTDGPISNPWLPPFNEGPTNHEIADQRWARSHSPRMAGSRFSTLMERLGFRKGGKGKFKMPDDP